MPKGVYNRRNRRPKAKSEHQVVYQTLLNKMDKGLQLIRESVVMGLLSEESAKEILAETIKALTHAMSKIRK